MLRTLNCIRFYSDHLPVNLLKSQYLQTETRTKRHLWNISLLLPQYVQMCTCRHKHILHAGPYEQNKNILLIYPSQRWQELIPDLTLYLQKVTGTSRDFQSVFKKFFFLPAFFTPAADCIKMITVLENVRVEYYISLHWLLYFASILTTAGGITFVLTHIYLVFIEDS